MSRPNLFITGAAGGFGRAVARRFAREGYFVGLYDLDAAPLAALADELGGPECAHYATLDVTDVAGAQAAVAAFARATGGTLQVLFNNAGTSAVGAFDDVAVERSRAVIDVNLFGVMNVAHAAMPLMRRTPGAHLINVSSASALHGNPELVAYSATKRAILSFSESLDIALRGTGVAVSDILPMYARTAIVEDVAHLHRRAPDIKLTADDVAEAVWDVVRTRRFRTYVGTDTKVFAPLSRVLPYRVRRWVTRRVLGW